MVNRKDYFLVSVGILVAIGVWVLFPQAADSQTPTPVTVFLTSGTTWTVPSNWNASNNTIECIGGGGGGASSGVSYAGSAGGGGGYSRATNVSLTPGASVTYSVGAGGVGGSGNAVAGTVGGDTWFNGATFAAASCGAKGGGRGTNRGAGGVGGAAASGIGAVKYSGGTGGAANGSFSSGEDTLPNRGGTGGGGAAGPNGNGANGGFGPCSGRCGGGGGGGSTSGGVGSNGNSSGLGGQGGNNDSGTGGGAGGATQVAGSAGTNGGGGGGGGGGLTGFAGVGGTGGAGTEWDPTHGVGGGGGGSGGAANENKAARAGNGGLYGGGGGGGGRSDGQQAAAFGAGGNGAQGIIVITYTPTVSPTVPGAPTSVNASASGEDIGVTWVAPASNGGSAITNYKIYRGTASPATTLIATVGAVTTYTDTTVSAGVTYYYRVKATNAVGDSAYSNEDSAIVATTCPPNPGSGGNIFGWAWSDTIGWISLNSGDEGTCTNVVYGLNAAGDGTISGYAWSEHVGWISAQAADVSGCPESPCTPKAQGGSVVGWMKALSATGAQSGGWDGWIDLSGTTYGLSFSDGALLGWAWGDTNAGWIDFSAEYECAEDYGYYCTSGVLHYKNPLCEIDTIPNVPETCEYQCLNGACIPQPNPDGSISAVPRLIVRGRTATISWSSTDTTSCSVSGNGDSWTGTSGSQTSSPITATVSYTLSCTGLDDTPITDSVTIRAVPFWREQ